MTPDDISEATTRDSHMPRRSTLGATIGVAAAVLMLAGCGAGGEPVDAGAAPSTAPTAVGAVADAEGTDCPAWANDVLAPTAIDSGADEDGWREHFLDRSDSLSEVAQGRPAADAVVIEAYADAVENFGNDPMSPGASRQMGEAAANAAAVAARSC